MPYTYEEWAKAFNVPPTAPKKRKRAAKHNGGRRRIGIACLTDAMRFISPDDYDTWIKVGMALKYELGEELGGAVWADWSEGCDEKFSEEANAAKLETFQRGDGELRTGESILYWARERGWDQAHYEFRDIFERTDPPPGEQPKAPGGKSSLLEFPCDISIEALIARQEDALVEGLLSEGDQAMLYAPPGKGKSFLALDLSWHIALTRRRTGPVAAPQQSREGWT